MTAAMRGEVLLAYAKADRAPRGSRERADALRIAGALAMRARTLLGIEREPKPTVGPRIRALLTDRVLRKEYGA